MLLKISSCSFQSQLFSELHAHLPTNM